MSATNRYLDEVKAKLGLTSDGQLANYWGITRQRIAHYRGGESAFSDERCLDIADILGVDPGRVMLEVQAERARKQQRTAVAETIEEVLRKLGGIAAAVLLFLSGIAPDHPAALQTSKISQSSLSRKVRQRFDSNTHYAKVANSIRLAFQRLTSLVLSAIKSRPLSLL